MIILTPCQPVDQYCGSQQPGEEDWPHHSGGPTAAPALRREAEREGGCCPAQDVGGVTGVLPQLRGGEAGEDQRGGNIPLREAVNDDAAGLGGLEEGEGVLVEPGPGDGGDGQGRHLASQPGWLASLSVQNNWQTENMYLVSPLLSSKTSIIY